jgi:Icc-related predicted phosphoesterase
MTHCLFVSDLHGDIRRYEKLLRTIAAEQPQAVFFGGDLLPSPLRPLGPEGFSYGDFIEAYLLTELSRLRERMKAKYPRVFVILGNDDGRMPESALLEASGKVIEYIHMRRATLDRFAVYGYSYIPPTPFLLKDWERYDVSRYVDPGSISPEGGWHSVSVEGTKERHETIKDDIEKLVGDDHLENAVFLFHAPPYETKLDRAALDGKTVDHVPLDPHTGSIAIKNFIEARQPLLTLHGHIHESARLTGSWKDRIGRTFAFSAAHDGPELALVRFDPEDLDSASRELI